MMSAPERAAFTSKFNLPGGKRATFRNTQGQEQMSVCHRGAGDDLPAPGKLNISSHYNAAAESRNAVMTAGMVRGWEGAGTGQPPSVRLSVRPSRSSCPPAELPQDPALTLQVGRRPLPRAG